MKPKLSSKSVKKIVSIRLRDEDRKLIESYDPLGSNSVSNGIAEIISLIKILGSPTKITPIKKTKIS